MPFPKDITWKMGVRDTSDYTALSIDPAKPFELGNKIWMNKPQRHELLSWVMAGGGGVEPTANHLFGHQERAANPNWVRYIGTTETASQGTSSLGIEDATLRLTAGSRLFNPRTTEVMRVTTIGTTLNQVTTMERNYGRGQSTDYLVNGDLLLMIPPNFAQGFTVGDGMTGGRVYKQFTTGIVDYPISLTDTEAAEKQIGGDPWTEQLDLKWMQATAQMQSEMLFGAEKQDNTGTTPVHVTKGLLDWIETNVFVVGGALTRMDLFDIIMETAMHSKDGFILATSKPMIYAINNWAGQWIRYEQSTDFDGWRIRMLKTWDDEYPLVEVDCLNEHPDLWGYIFLIPTGNIKYRPLVGNQNLDVKYLPIMRDEVMRKEGHIYGQYGWEYFLEETFGIVKGVRF